VGPFSLIQYRPIFGESRTVDGDLHPVRWGLRGLADLAHALGADSQIESILDLRGDETSAVVSGAVSPGADVHAYIVSVPGPFDSSAPRAINEGVIEVLGPITGQAHFAFTTEDATADVGVAEGLYSPCPCGAGDLVSLSHNILVTEDASGSATVRGNEYKGQYGPVGMPQVRFTIAADGVTIPTTGEQLLTLSSSFSYSGYVRGATPFAGRYDYLFAVALRGAGTATIQLFSCDTCILPDGRRYYFQTKLQYVFDGSSESVVNSDSGTVLAIPRLMKRGGGPFPGR
jgi:hypothetical protein